MNLKRTLFILPNLFTLSSLFCGLYATILAASGQASDDYYRAALVITFAIFFDAFDGRVARLTKTQSAFGIEIDSLSDVVSFGVAPATLIYRWSLAEVGTVGLLVSFAFVACGAIRLARFNLIAHREAAAGAKPGKYIIGLPIPGAAGVLVSLVVANHVAGGNLRGATVLLAIVTIGLSLLMVSRVRFRSFKDLRLNWRTILMVVFVVSSSIFLAARSRPAFVLVWLLGCYVAIGVLETLIGWPRRHRERRRARQDEAAAARRDEP